MKEISELILAEDVRYAEDHEWAGLGGDVVRVGVSDYAQDQLGDITFVELPEVGDVLEKGDEFGTLESTKAVSELYMPVGGEITAVNSALEHSPDLVNKSPYKDGWMIELRPADREEYNELMSREEYLDFLESQEESD
ncbi:MAG: glycine cleavage system protein GcvH [Pseudomonadota bacterium]